MKLARDQHVDWPAVVRQIEAVGWTKQQIAKKAGCEFETLRKWAGVTETQPRHDDGERLLAVWVQVTGQARETAPVVSRYAAR